MAKKTGHLETLQPCSIHIKTFRSRGIVHQHSLKISSSPERDASVYCGCEEERQSRRIFLKIS